MTMRRQEIDPRGLLNEHRAIQAAARSLRSHLRIRDPLRGDHWVRRLGEELDVLAGLLRPHFEREEAGGMFDAIVKAEPRFAGECARLRRQHAAMLDRLAALERRLVPSRSVTRDVDALRCQTRELLDDLAHHEESENALLVGAMEGEEVGAAD